MGLLSSTTGAYSEQGVRSFWFVVVWSSELEIQPRQMYRMAMAFAVKRRKAGLNDSLHCKSVPFLATRHNNETEDVMGSIPPYSSG